MSHTHRWKQVYARLLVGGWGTFWRCEYCGEFHPDFGGAASALEAGTTVIALEEVPRPLRRRAYNIAVGKTAAAMYDDAPAPLM